jgi:hypothetical protein
MKDSLTSPPHDLFVNSDPAIVWRKAANLLGRMHPGFDFSIARTLFDDVVRLFRGEYPGYYPIKTPYHDLSHTMDAFICAVRLMHGMKISGASLSGQEVTLVMAAMLLHDIGYAQMRNGKETGTGAQYTRDHVERGIAFLHSYLAAHDLSASLAADLEPMIRCSDPTLPLARIKFPNARTRLLGQIVGTADLVGQMADRNYLEKLAGLYREFQEGHVGNYNSVYDMLCKTHEFYGLIKKRLDQEFGGIYDHLASHFQETLDTPHNYYMEAVEKNMAHIEQLERVGESDYQSLLRRGGGNPGEKGPRRRLH